MEETKSDTDNESNGENENDEVDGKFLQNSCSSTCNSCFSPWQ